MTAAAPTRLTPREGMAIAIARELAGTQTMLIGAASAVPLAAGLLAQALHTPELTIFGAGVYINPRRLVADLSAGWDCKPVAIADMSDVFAITEQGVDVMFYGGMQIDATGCVNLHRVQTGSGVLRGPGLANTMLGHTARRTILYTERHDRRTLVPTVDYASVVGLSYHGRSRSDLGLPNAGPQVLITPDVVLRPDRTARFTEAQLLQPVPWTDVQARTGWALPDDEPALFAATADEVAVLRNSIDPARLLAGPEGG
jgi:glutaconate CoA-transferase subunit B